MKPWGWTEEQLQTLHARYADADNKSLAAELGVSVKTLVSKASQQGLKKSREAIRRCHVQPGSRQGDARQLLVAADKLGLRATDLAELLGVHGTVAQKTLNNMTCHGLAWIVRGRRGESRWYAELALAQRAKDAVTGRLAVTPPAPPAPAMAPPQPEAQPITTAQTRRVVAPAMPDRYAVDVPTEGGFSSRRPGDYPMPASRWAAAVTRQL